MSGSQKSGQEASLRMKFVKWCSKLTNSQKIWWIGLVVALIPMLIKGGLGILFYNTRDSFFHSIYVSFTGGAVLWMGITLLAMSVIYALFEYDSYAFTDEIELACFQGSILLSAILWLCSFGVYLFLVYSPTSSVQSVILSVVLLIVFVLRSWAVRIWVKKIRMEGQK